MTFNRETNVNLKFVYQTTATIAAALAMCLSQPSNADSATLTDNSKFVAANSLSSTNTLPDRLTRQFQTTLDQAVKDNIPPGTSVGIVTPQGSWFGASGVSNLATGTPVVPSDRFAIGSVTKTFTATTILQLAQEGILSLDDSLSQWLPEIAANISDGENVTIRQILNGTSGIYNFLDADSLINQEILNNPLREWQPEEIVQYAYNKPRSSSWVYPNTGFILAGMVIEKATGSNLAQEIRDRILTPLKLNNTFFAQEAIPGGFVNGYRDVDGDGSLDDVTALNLSWAWAAGAMISNTQDLSRFSRALFGGELLSQDSLNQMLTFNRTGDEFFGIGYGLGAYSVDFDPLIPGLGRGFGHGGDAPGHNAFMFYFPERDITVVSLQNSQPPNDVNPVIPILTTLLEEGRGGSSKSVPEPSLVTGLMILGAGKLLRYVRSPSRKAK
ncbi:MAG: beta-lactamase family protein [Hydrococcus sp. Prado102]|jgi:D-alanyl-D-alanine carboxypeptidase|nr:beta-lactamase family protein [Hydrococcus sp. Prado102]